MRVMEKVRHPILGNALERLAQTLPALLPALRPSLPQPPLAASVYA